MRAGDGAEAPSEARNRKYRAGQLGIERHLTREIADAAACLESLTLTVEAENRRAAAGRPHEIEQHADGGRLAGAVGAEEAEHLALRDLERQVLEADDGAVVLVSPRVSIAAAATCYRRDPALATLSSSAR